MSGGVDSSILAKYSPGVRGVHLDSGMELEHARAAAAAFGLQLTALKPALDEVDDLLCRYAAVTGEPSMACAAPALVGKALQGQIKVCLSANGADELFLGYWRTLHDDQMWHIFRRRVDLGPGYDHDPELDALDIPLLDAFDADTRADRQWFELNTYVRYDLNPVLDYSTMLSSVEARVPFLDHRVVERALTMPSSEKVDPSLGDAEKGRKAPLKSLLKDYRHIWDRRKLGFSLPRRITQSPERSRRVGDMLERRVVKSLECVGPFAARDRIYLINSLWSLACWFEYWVGRGYLRDELLEG